MAIALIQVVGIVAGSITAISMLPQLIKVVKEKKVENISIGMVITLITGLIFWAIYGFLIKDMIIIITNLFSLLVNFILLGLRIKYRK
jgi:MtN3 and saliva related transmembrane protein